MPLSKLPRRRLAVVTCMDCRIDPLGAAGLELGDAHVIRNAGAIVTADVRRSLTISQRALGTNEVWVVAHTDCGALGLDDEAFLAALEADGAGRPDWAPGGFDSLEGSVRTSIAALVADPAVRSDAVRGFVLDVESGTMTDVTAG